MPNLYDELSWRGLIADATEGLSELFEKERVTAYIGFDPTASSLHVGSLLTVMGLARLQPFFVTDDAMLSHDRYLGIRGSCGLHYRRAIAARLISCLAGASSLPCAQTSTATRRAARRCRPG